MQHVGYSLIDKLSNQEVLYWGNDFTRCASLPDMIIMPNGDSVHAPTETYENDNYKLVKRYIDLGTTDISLRVNEEIAFDGEKVVVTYIYREPSNSELLDYSALKRYEKEVGGITVNSDFINTDRQTQATLTNLITIMIASPNTVINFKTGSGFITANSEVILNIALSVSNHVQACFTKEQVLAGSIANNEIYSYDQIISYYNT